MMINGEKASSVAVCDVIAATCLVVLFDLIMHFSALYTADSCLVFFYFFIGYFGDVSVCFNYASVAFTRCCYFLG